MNRRDCFCHVFVLQQLTVKLVSDIPGLVETQILVRPRGLVRLSRDYDMHVTVMFTCSLTQISITRP